MLRAQVLRRSFSLWNRPPVTSRVASLAARHDHQTINIQRVHIRKPFLRRSRLYGFAFVVAGAYLCLKWLDVEVQVEVIEEDDGEWQEADGHASDEDEEELEPLLFFPTGLSRAKPRQVYNKSDPEYLEYTRIGQDADENLRIRMELVGLVRQSIAKHPFYRRRMGVVDPSRGMSWAVIIFPLGPPVEFERPGFELMEDGSLRRATQPVHPLHHRRLDSILHPTPVAYSLYAQVKKKAAELWAECTTWSSGLRIRGKAKEISAKLAPAASPPDPAKTDPTAQNSRASSLSGATDSSSATADRDIKTPPQSLGPPPPTDSLTPPPADRFLRILPSLPTPQSLTLDLSTFRRTLRQGSRKQKVDIPRGACAVVAQVEVVGEQATVNVRAQGVYDPSAKKYVLVVADVQSMYKQRRPPRGST